MCRSCAASARAWASSRWGAAVPPAQHHHTLPLPCTILVYHPILAPDMLH